MSSSPERSIDPAIMQSLRGRHFPSVFAAGAVLFGILLTACDSPLEIESVEIIAPDSVVRVGETLALTVVMPRGGDPVWMSSDTTVASVDQGIVRGVRPGSVSVTAENDRFQGRLDLEVLPGRGRLEIRHSRDVVKVGETLWLTMWDPSEARPTWASSDSSIATVQPGGYAWDGVVTGQEPGRVTISAWTEDYYGETQIRVVQAIPDTIQIRAESRQLKVGESMELSVDLPDSIARTWSTSNASIATVDHGTVAGRNGGIVTISMATDTLFGSIELEVLAPYRIYAPVGVVTLRPGMDFLIGEFVLGGSSTRLQTADLAFSSSATAIVTVDGEGQVTAHSTGDAEIRITGPDLEPVVVEVTVVGDFDAVMLHDFTVHAVNNRQQVVGFRPSGRPAAWQDGRYREVMPATADTVLSIAINDLGQIALAGADSGGSAAIWILDPDGTERVFEVGGSAGAVSWGVSNLRINTRGTVAGLVPAGAMLIRNGKAETLPAPDGPLRGIGLNDNDVVAYGRVVVENGVARPIAMPAGADPESWSVTDINNGGQIVGFSYVRGHAFGGFRGTAEASTLFPHAALWGMNDRGDAVGSTYAGVVCTASCQAYFVESGADEGQTLSVGAYLRTSLSQFINDEGVIAAIGSQPYAFTMRHFSLLLIPR